MSDWSKKRRTLIIIPKGVTTKAKNFQTKKIVVKKFAMVTKETKDVCSRYCQRRLTQNFEIFESKKMGA